MLITVVPTVVTAATMMTFFLLVLVLMLTLIFVSAPVVPTLSPVLTEDSTGKRQDE